MQHECSVLIRSLSQFNQQIYFSCCICELGVWAARATLNTVVMINHQFSKLVFAHCNEGELLLTNLRRNNSDTSQTHLKQELQVIKQNNEFSPFFLPSLCYFWYRALARTSKEPEESRQLAFSLDFPSVNSHLYCAAWDVFAQ